MGYIEREAVVKHIQEIYCAGCNSYHGVRCRACGTGDAIDIIEDFPPADVATVTRCKDCKWDRPDALLDKHWCSRFLGSMEVREDDFCSYGEPKEGRGNNGNQ